MGTQKIYIFTIFVFFVIMNYIFPLHFTIFSYKKILMTNTETKSFQSNVNFYRLKLGDYSVDSIIFATEKMEEKFLCYIF